MRIGKPVPVRTALLFALSLSGSTALLARGEFLWRFEVGAAVSSSPAVDDQGTIYIGSETDRVNEGVSWFFALKPDGSYKWYAITGIVLGTPALDAFSTIYFGDIAGFFYAILPDSGDLKWLVTNGSLISGSAAVAGDGTIYIGFGDNNLYSIQPDGFLNWSFKTGDVIQGSPAVSYDGTVYFGSNDHTFYALDPEDGSLKWSFPTGANITDSPAIDSDSTIYFGSWDGYLYALTPEPALKWKFKTGSVVSSSPSIGPDGTIYFGSWDNYLYALDRQGNLVWKFKAGDVIDSSPAVGADGAVYFGSWDSTFYALNSDGSQRWTYKTGDWVSSSPTITNEGVLYFGSHDGFIYALDPGTGQGLADSPWPKFRKDLRNSGSSQVVAKVLAGDLDGNNKIDIFDLLELLKVLGGASPSPLADVDRNGKTDIFDLLALLKLLGGGGSSSALASAGRFISGNYEGLDFSFDSTYRVTFPDRSTLEFRPGSRTIAELQADGGTAAALLASPGGGADKRLALPKAFALAQNYPNPFNPSTTVEYTLPQGFSDKVSLKIYDLTGRLVRSLFEGQRQSGTYSQLWDGTDEHGRRAASGVYFYRLSAGAYSDTRKMILLK
ncbi:MAG: hypothetical protein A2Z86_05575 [Candidatus Glassbacteria bacterium GWA2_58_10]|uniref:Dockerin domain-containing protein n=1 Tax=Candidatus Glassbacteria bacterium GWA2_58_10 TaxID=1817865 RepID=A0A1F5YDZ3_9BACT|nr:MAG: hypothetical protein A2Z86_05575 [Candidatus Glassbacteria bacterium GWA2_58_10]